MRLRISSRRLLVDGFWIGCSFTLFVTATLWANPWLWLSDYPPEIREMVGNPPDVPTWQRLGAAALGVALVLVPMVVSTYRLGRSGGRERDRRPGLAVLATHAFLLFQLVNLWDVLIVDWLLFATFTPPFAVLPGTEGAPAYQDYAFHLRASFLEPTPWIGAVAAALLVAFLAHVALRMTTTGAPDANAGRRR